MKKSRICVLFALLIGLLFVIWPPVPGYVQTGDVTTTAPLVPSSPDLAPVSANKNQEITRNVERFNIALEETQEKMSVLKRQQRTMRKQRIVHNYVRNTDTLLVLADSCSDTQLGINERSAFSSFLMRNHLGVFIVPKIKPSLKVQLTIFQKEDSDK